MTNVKVERKDVLSEQETENMLDQADNLKSEYYRLRAKALISILKTGKRRAEVAALEPSDIEEDGQFLNITFSVVKKRKKKVLATRRRKRFPINSSYAKHILNYNRWMRVNQPRCRYLFPSVTSVFGVNLAFHKNAHLSGRQLLRIIKQVNPEAWCHLFRETRGAEVVRADEKRLGEASLLTVYRVKHALDLERETTAWNYINRYATETILQETD